MVEIKTNFSEFDSYDAAGNDFSKQFYRPPREADFVYDENNLPLGVTLDGEIFTMDMRDAPKGVFLGFTGTGKTFFIRGISDRLNKLGYTIIFPTDVKNEMWSSNKPVQQKFVKALLQGEEPCKMPVVTLRPTFFKQAGLNQLPPYNYWFSPLLSEMEKTDFNTILGIDSKQASQAQKLAGEAIFNIMKKEPKKYSRYEDFDQLISAITDLKDEQKNQFRLKIRNLFDSGFFMVGNDVIHDAVELSSQGYVVALNLENFELFAKTGAGYPQVLVSMVFRSYLKARRGLLNKEKIPYKINRLFAFFDESNSFVPKNKEPSSKVETIDSVKRDRRYGVYHYFAYQSWNDIPEDVVTNCRYCFLPHNVSLLDMMSAFESFTTMRVDSTRRNRLREIQKRCKKTRHGWIVLDRKTGLHTIITPLSPMSFHMEMSK